jgi:hypothetical protein
MILFLPFTMWKRIVHNPIRCACPSARRINRVVSVRRFIMMLGLIAASVQPAVWQDVAASASSHIKGAPLSAVQITTTKVLLTGGGYKVTTKEVRLARSSEGLVRREVHDSIDGEHAVRVQ